MRNKLKLLAVLAMLVMMTLPSSKAKYVSGKTISIEVKTEVKPMEEKPVDRYKKTNTAIDTGNREKEEEKEPKDDRDPVSEESGEPQEKRGQEEPEKAEEPDDLNIEKTEE